MLNGYYINKMKGWITVDFYYDGVMKGSCGGYTFEDAVKRFSVKQFEKFKFEEKLTKRQLRKVGIYV